MSRFRKLLMVGLVLGLGLGMAWPFRKTGLEPTNSLSGVARQPNLEIAFEPTNRDQPPALGQASDSPAVHVVARMASTGEGGASIASADSSIRQGASFDLAKHPVIANQADNSTISPVTPTDRPSTMQPAYANSNSDPGLATGGDVDTPDEVLHIVRNSDTLEKLAERYLGDGGRALEIFDLNRDRLENPHLLPIGAELRIPVDPARMVE